MFQRQSWPQRFGSNLRRGGISQAIVRQYCPESQAVMVSERRHELELVWLGPGRKAAVTRNSPAAHLKRVH